MQTIHSIISIGYDNYRIDVESHASNGLPTTTIVGLASKAVDESKERVRAAIQASGFQYPKRKITINLAPAELPKESTCLDLAIALAILQADSHMQIPKNAVFLGELGLEGTVRGVSGLLGKMRLIDDTSTLYIPAENAIQASMIEALKDRVYVVDSLRQLIDHFTSHAPLHHPNELTAARTPFKPSRTDDIDIADIQGQETAKRALVIAAAGGHNILLEGPPGTGKSMLAKALVTILPDLTRQQIIETTHIHSISGKQATDTLVTSVPFRSPHHSATDVSLIGGGQSLKPGEISLAHNGVLFLDELPEFRRSTIEALRQPLEDRTISIARAQARTVYPARFMLVATSNPCPCGFLNSDKPCTCTAAQIQQYQKKLSGPILDRIDIFVHVGNVQHEHLLHKSTERLSPGLKKQIEEARLKQMRRQRSANSNLSNRLLKEHIHLSADAERLLNDAARGLDLSPRAYMRVLKVARTIADLENAPVTDTAHVTEALQYRRKPITV